MTDDNDSGARGGSVTAIALIDLVRSARDDGPTWSQSTDDLNLNLVVLRAGHRIEGHINSDVDVLLVGVEGSGTITVDGQSMTLEAGQLVVVPKGAARSITPLSSRFGYLSCHQRRPGLWPRPRG